MNCRISINNGWYFKSHYEEGDELFNNLEGFEKVNLPHAGVELPYNYFDEKIYQMVSCYKYPFELPKDYAGKLAYVHFEGVMAYARVYLNGIYIGEHKGGYTPFDIRLDTYYNWDLKPNMLTVVVDSNERNDIPPFGGTIDFLTYAGIYREACINIHDSIFISNIKIETPRVLEDEKSVSLKVYIENSLLMENVDAEFNIHLNERCGSEVVSKSFKTRIDGCTGTYSFEIRGLKAIKLWDIDEPNLYELTVDMKAGMYSDQYVATFGFRKAEFTPGGFYLNGRLLKLIGLNRHQSYPYVGYAMPRRVQYKDAEILKRDLHVNLVRTSHYPQSRHFLDRCDELGLLVFEEMPGWQFIGDEKWKEVAKANLREMIMRDWNHPSIILWGVRINESADDDEFYAETNRIAHELDGSRQTGGVRNAAKSRLFEDVYTMNDFIYDGMQKPLRKQQEVTALDYKVPYLVTEFGGHMFPTKRFDCEERQVEHAMRHLKVQDAAFLDDSNCGAIGWCAFDYNTHKDFGSGDRICYHGVMDMFRIHKFAAYAYKSQVSPAVEPVLEPMTFWARGERSIGGVIPLVVFTNCDYIDMVYGSDKAVVGIYPDRENFKGIPYPPVIVDYRTISPDLIKSWGMVWEDVIFTGYWNGRKVIEKRFCKDPVPSELQVMPDDWVLNSSEKDVTRIVVKVLDQCGNILPFIDEIIDIEVAGPAKLQGPNRISVKGGAVAFWIETLNQAGEVTVSVCSNRLGSKRLSISVK